MRKSPTKWGEMAAIVAFLLGVIALGSWVVNSAHWVRHGLIGGAIHDSLQVHVEHQHQPRRGRH